jgi:GT2 family glycosyltransferase
MLVSAVMVHYRAPELACRAATALRSDCARAGLDCEIVVVDNGSDPADRSTLETAADRLITPGANLGYAGGLNRGISQARGTHLLLSNPDVLVLSGCVPDLLGALEAGAAAAGPRFYWDVGRRFLLPPTEECSRREALLQYLASAAPAVATLARQRWRRHARRHWLATEPLESVSLSGALLAVRRDAWERVGPFDEGFPLYFEETDWLLRLARAGLTALHVPGAEAVHLYDQSASAEPRSRVWFAESRRRFERRHYGAVGSALLGAAERLARPGAAARGEVVAAPCPEVGRTHQPPELGLAVPPGAVAPLWVEVSPSPSGFPAAAERLAAPASDTIAWTLLREVWRRLRPGTYHVRVADARDREGPATAVIRG